VPADALTTYDCGMQGRELEAAVAARFIAVNGEHRMTSEDDDYATAWYASVEAVAAAAGRTPDELRRLMLVNRLPLPSYIRSDGTQMVPRDLLALVERAGGVDELPEWFAAHFDDPAAAVAEWDAYLSGQYVCLRSVTPEHIRRKGELAAAIREALTAPRPSSPEWRLDLHRLVDELDQLEPPFAPYDRLRFGGPISRDTLIDDVRARFPRAVETQPV
jgi:hypothetical protein